MEMGSQEGLGSDEQLAKLFKTIESNPVIVVVCEVCGTICNVNGKFTDVSGYTTAELVGTSVHDLTDQGREEIHQMMSSVLAGKEWSGAIHSRKKTGETYLVDASIFPIQNSLGVVTHFVKVAEDITARRLTEESVRHLAFYNDLTALPNRRLFHDRLRQSLARNLRSGEILAVISLNLDHFKKINNSYGHHVGDLVIKILAERASRRLRTGDTLAHIAGDSFMILLPIIKRGENAAKVAQNILESIAEPIHIHGAPPLYVTGSAGISFFPDDAGDAAALLKNTEIAMFKAKDLGGNRYQIFTPSMHDSAVRRMGQETDLRRAIDTNALVLHYQPQFDCRCRTLVGAEALVRITGADGRLVPPADFISLGEETGLIARLSSWVMATACREAAALHAAGLSELRVAINLSPCDFAQQNLPEQVAGCLLASGLPARFLELEITEGTIMADFERTTAMLHEIKSTGVTITIDDFGTGYSSLSTLKSLPVNTLKIDCSFVRELSPEGEGRAIIRAIITLAHDLGMQVVAEGVETKEQADILSELGCDLLQGFYFGRPMSASEFLVFAGKGD